MDLEPWAGRRGGCKRSDARHHSLPSGRHGGLVDGQAVRLLLEEAVPGALLVGIALGERHAAEGLAVGAHGRHAGAGAVLLMQHGGVLLGQKDELVSGAAGGRGQGWRDGPSNAAALRWPRRAGNPVRPALRPSARGAAEHGHHGSSPTRCRCGAAEHGHQCAHPRLQEPSAIVLLRGVRRKKALASMLALR